MSSQNLPARFDQSVELAIPALRDRPVVILDFSKIKEGERRLVEARIVNVSTYNDLEYSFNEGYREARANLAVIGYEITQAESMWRKIQSELILDEYPAFLKEKGLKDNAMIRDAFLERNQGYVDARERINMLKAMDSLVEGKIKVFENVCRYMKKQMDITVRSINPNKY